MRNLIRPQAVTAPRPYTRAPLDPVLLKVTPETECLVLVHKVDGYGAEDLPKPGSFAVSVPPKRISEEWLITRLQGRVAGGDQPEWADGHWGALQAGVNVSRVLNVHVAPRFGAVIDAQGRVFASTIEEALYFTPSLGALPHVQLDEARPQFHPPTTVAHLDRAAVWLSWGGIHNYGHFLLDCMACLQTFAEEGLLEGRRPIAPPLTPWQRDLLSMLLPERLRPIEVDCALLHVDDVVFASCMDHFLHSPNEPLRRMRQRMLSHTRAGHASQRRLYLSRYGDQKRWLINEFELEAAMRARGFTIIRPETLAVEEQARLFRHAEVVVSATGAGLANCLFMEPETKVFEIQPTNFTGVWVRSLCELLGIFWHGFFSPSPISEQPIYVEGVLKPGVSFSWTINLPEFLDFLDSHI